MYPLVLELTNRFKKDPVCYLRSWLVSVVVVDVVGTAAAVIGYIKYGFVRRRSMIYTAACRQKHAKTFEICVFQRECIVL